MKRQTGGTRSLRWFVYAILACGVVAGTGYFMVRGYYPNEAKAQESQAAPVQSARVHVDVSQPHKAGDRTTSQPGSVYAFESVQLYAGVSGYLKTMNVDI